jgi:hypothetical protein
VSPVCFKAVDVFTRSLPTNDDDQTQDEADCSNGTGTRATCWQPPMPFQTSLRSQAAVQYGDLDSLCRFSTRHAQDNFCRVLRKAVEWKQSLKQSKKMSTVSLYIIIKCLVVMLSLEGGPFNISWDGNQMV